MLKEKWMSVGSKGCMGQTDSLRMFSSEVFLLSWGRIRRRLFNTFKNKLEAEREWITICEFCYVSYEVEI